MCYFNLFFRTLFTRRSRERIYSMHLLVPSLSEFFNGLKIITYLQQSFSRLKTISYCIIVFYYLEAISSVQFIATNVILCSNFLNTAAMLSIVQQLFRLTHPFCWKLICCLSVYQLQITKQFQPKLRLASQWCYT